MQQNESRNSKRSVVFTKKSNVQTSGTYDNNLGQPSTPQGSITKAQNFEVQLHKQQTQNQNQRIISLQHGSTQSSSVTNGGNTQIRVNQVPNSVKVTKNIKNVIYQQQLREKQYQQMQIQNQEVDMNNQNAFQNSNSRGMLNTKRRSNAIELTSGGSVQNQARGHQQLHVQNQNSQGRKKYSQSNNHTDQGQGMMIHSAQGQQFNKTLTNMMHAGPQQLQTNGLMKTNSMRMDGTDFQSHTKDQNGDGVKNAMLVVKLNQINPNPAQANAMPLSTQQQLDNDCANDPEAIGRMNQQLQLQQMQAEHGNNTNQQNNLQSSNRTNRTYSMNLRVGHQYDSVGLRPQSQNNRGQINLTNQQMPDNLNNKNNQATHHQNSQTQMMNGGKQIVVTDDGGQRNISAKHQQIQHIRQINNSSIDQYQNGDNEDELESQGSNRNFQRSIGMGSNGQNSPGNSKYFLKNQLRHISKLIDAEDDDMDCAGNDEKNNSEYNQFQEGGHMNFGGNRNGGGGMTLEDDVESILSEHFNASNESMFRIRPGGLAAGQNIGGGDSTYRGMDDSVFGFEDEKGMISESEDGGWYASDREGQSATGNKVQGGAMKRGDDDEFDDISEHSSDDVSDSDQEAQDPSQPKKVKKTKGEKGERKKKKKKKQEAEATGQIQDSKKQQSEPNKLVQTYKQLEDGVPLKKDNTVKMPQKSQSKQPDEKKKKKDTNTPMKVDIQSKKSTNAKANLNSSPQVTNKGNKIDKNTQNKEKGKQNQQNTGKTQNPAPAPAKDETLKKAKKNGLKLQALNHALPKNLQECHERFFESDFKINPQFEYENALFAQKFLEQFDEPDGQYLEIAKTILDSFLKEYGSESAYLDAEGRKLDQEETHQYIKDYLTNLGVEEWISVNFQKNQVAPTSVTHDPKTGKCKMNIKLPCEYRLGRMIGVLDHEIGTHFLRKHNEKNQQWYKKRDKFEMRTCIATEEGLACTNQMVQTVKDGNCKPFLYRSALNYYAAYMAKNLSFVDLFKDLERYVDSPQARWKFTLRVKRGLTDTSQKGGLYKDQVYLEGAVQVLSLRKTLNFKALLCGKISLYDYDREAIQNILNYEGQLLPPFMEDMDEYHRCLDVIADTNHIHEFQPTGDNFKFCARQDQRQRSVPYNLAEKSADENKNQDQLEQSPNVVNTKPPEADAQPPSSEPASPDRLQQHQNIQPATPFELEMQSLPPLEDKPEKELVIPDEDDDPLAKEALNKQPEVQNKDPLHQRENNCEAGRNPALESAIDKQESR